VVVTLHRSFSRELLLPDNPSHSGQIDAVRTLVKDLFPTGA
jgi:hypothetical protein